MLEQVGLEVRFKTGKIWNIFRWVSKEFQTVGAMKAKDLLLNIFRFVLGSLSSFSLEDLRVQENLYVVRVCDK